MTTLVRIRGTSLLGLQGGASRHRVYISFMLRDGWFCQFLEEDLKTPQPRKLNFKSPGKIRELARRGGCTLNLEGLQALDRGIEIGCGGLWLELSDEQYAKLKGS